ncbi:glycosyltransferase, partial [Thermodesulfobacteriota bacterium]
MNNFWDTILKPVMQAIEAKTVVEIGALEGANTKKLTNFFEHGGTLHVIDPEPKFKATDFKDKIIFHQDISLNVIPKLPQFDVGIIDGDHNWYTVYNELKQIELLHKNDAQDFPVLFLHDIHWPYGRRDLYYISSTIPDEFRHPAACGGILWKKSKLSPTGGMNIQLYNAQHEGGPRNGVLTAIEDFMAESAIEFELIQFPAYFGVGILVSKERKTHDENLSRSLSKVTDPKGLLRIMDTLETIRVKAMIRQQELYREVHQLRKKQAGKPKRQRPLPLGVDKDQSSIDLSVIVIVFNMRREAARTLHSLSRNYQRNIAGLSYEVIVVENGSTEPLSEEFVNQYGDNFSYYNIEDAPSSPAYAINYGASKARGNVLSIMIDGAHMLTPGIFKHAMNAFKIYPKPVVATRYWFLGPGQQGETIQQGYDKNEEDRLLQRIKWPQKGYRLFEIGVFILGDTTNWFKKPFESNCLFMRRETFDAIGG